MDAKTMETQYDSHLSKWRENEKSALDLLKKAGDLRFDKSIEILIFRRDLYNQRPTQVLNDHLFAKNYSKQPLTVQMSVEIASIIEKLDLAPCRIDVGTLAMNWFKSDQKMNLEDFVAHELSSFIGQEAKEAKNSEPRDVVLYGFGRIGRLAARCLIEMTTQIKSHSTQTKKQKESCRRISKESFSVKKGFYPWQIQWYYFGR